MCNFVSLLLFIFFYVQNMIPTNGDVVWDKTRPVTQQINDFKARLVIALTLLWMVIFRSLRGKKKRSRIHQSLVDQYYDDICFLVEIDFSYAQEVLPRVSWLRPLDYEVNIDEVAIAIKNLLVEEVYNNSKAFGRYELAKVKIIVQINM